MALGGGHFLHCQLQYVDFHVDFGCVLARCQLVKPRIRLLVQALFVIGPIYLNDEQAGGRRRRCCYRRRGMLLRNSKPSCVAERCGSRLRSGDVWITKHPGTTEHWHSLLQGQWKMTKESSGFDRFKQVFGAKEALHDLTAKFVVKRPTTFSNHLSTKVHSTHHFLIAMSTLLLIAARNTSLSILEPICQRGFFCVPRARHPRRTAKSYEPFLL